MWLLPYTMSFWLNYVTVHSVQDLALLHIFCANLMMHYGNLWQLAVSTNVVYSQTWLFLSGYPVFAELGQNVHRSNYGHNILDTFDNLPYLLSVSPETSKWTYFWHISVLWDGWSQVLQIWLYMFIVAGTSQWDMKFPKRMHGHSHITSFQTSKLLIIF